LNAKKSSAEASPSRLVIHDLAQRNGHAEFSQDIRAGLTSNPRHLFPKYLYDELGSRLFEAICEVDEYYPTRAEDEILKTHAEEIAGCLPTSDTLIEMGSGSAEKTRRLIETFTRQRHELLFIPVDISPTALAAERAGAARFVSKSAHRGVRRRLLPGARGTAGPRSESGVGAVPWIEHRQF
jgi:uncharacterized SAM-dependent methyltransferase